MLCAFRHVFGRERQGFHSVRVADVAVLDVIGTVAIGLVLAWWRGWHVGTTLLTLFLLSVLLHWLFCVDTKVKVWLLGPFTPWRAR